MPYKLRNNRRHKFDKATYKIENWPEYNEALKERGNITFWFSEEAIKQWDPKQNKKRRPGAQIKYSNLAIQTGITIKAVYNLPFRATEGFLNSISEIMKLKFYIPDHTTFCRRSKRLEIENLKSIDPNEHLNLIIDSTGLKIFGAGEWHEEKHGLKKRRKWRKLHIIIDKETHQIISSELTEQIIADDSQVSKLLERVEGNINSFKGDMAYDTDEVYEAIEQKAGNKISIAIPPRKDAALSMCFKNQPTKRDENILFVEEQGKYKWQDQSSFGAQLNTLCFLQIFKPL